MAAATGLLSWVRASRLHHTYQGGFQRNLKWESQSNRMRPHTGMRGRRASQQKAGHTLNTEQKLSQKHKTNDSIVSEKKSIMKPPVTDRNTTISHTPSERSAPAYLHNPEKQPALGQQAMPGASTSLPLCLIFQLPPPPAHYQPRFSAEARLALYKRQVLHPPLEQTAHSPLALVVLNRRERLLTRGSVKTHHDPIRATTHKTPSCFSTQKSHLPFLSSAPHSI